MENYVERYRKSTDQYVNHTYEENGNKRYYTVYEELFIRDDDDGDFVITNEKELRFMLSNAKDIIDDEKSPSYTEEEINEMVDAFRKRKEKYKKRLRRYINHKALETPISELIGK